MKKEGEIKLDPRLEGVDLYDPEAVFKALGGNEWNPSEDHFDLDAYLRLPIGKRLLTHEELLCLDERDRRPIPMDFSDPYFAYYDSLCTNEANGGANEFEYDWNPQTKKPVYPKGYAPDIMVWGMKKNLGPKGLAEKQKQWEEVTRIGDLLRREESEYEENGQIKWKR